MLVVQHTVNTENIQIDPDLDYCKAYTAPPISCTWCDCRPGMLIPPEGLQYIAENCPRSKRDHVDTFLPHYGPIDG